MILKKLIDKYKTFFKPNKIDLIEITDTEINAMENIINNSISKDRLREELKELDEKSRHCAISDLPEYMYKKEVIQKLLGE